MKELQVTPIGYFHCDDTGFRIQLEPEYIPALAGLAGFSHLSVIWWFSHCDNPEARSLRRVESPYVAGPKDMGIFATRSPTRPNPLALSCLQVLSIHEDKGVIHLAWTDAEDGTPVLDLKPYTPSADRVEEPRTPNWCAHWPKSLEDSEGFDWAAEFNF